MFKEMRQRWKAKLDAKAQEITERLSKANEELEAQHAAEAPVRREPTPENINPSRMLRPHEQPKMNATSSYTPSFDERCAQWDREHPRRRLCTRASLTGKSLNGTFCCGEEMRQISRWASQMPAVRPTARGAIA